jgi:hypothetical protein
MIRKIRVLLSLSLLMSVLAVGCGFDWLPVATSTPTELPSTSTPSPEPSETPVWFPATATRTPPQPRATSTPVPDLRPVGNEIIWQETFTSGENWDLLSLSDRSVQVGGQALTLALKNYRGSLYSFTRTTMPNNYYLTLTIAPSLCRGQDQYGIVFRSQTPQDFYRVTFLCDGTLRLELVRGDSVVRLAEVMNSPQLFAGPTATIQLSVWVHEDGIKVYINDIQQVDYYRLQWFAGGFGVFARSTGEHSLTVSFSNLVVRESASMPPTPVPTDAPTPLPTRTRLSGP